MRVFAIGDLHLPGGQSKPMEVFGAHWENHFDKIRRDWCERVGEEDVVLVPGDICWAMQMQQALPDLEEVCALPGKKIFLRGNHDYWWSSVSRLRAVLPEGCYALQNDALVLSGVCFAGTRGWTVLAPGQGNPQDQKIFRREVMRLELSLKEARRIAPELPLVVLMHFPPFSEKREPSPFTDLIAQYGVNAVVYGHLHAEGLHAGYDGEWDGVAYHLVSCDYLDFTLRELTLV